MKQALRAPVLILWLCIGLLWLGHPVGTVVAAEKTIRQSLSSRDETEVQTALRALRRIEPAEAKSYVSAVQQVVSRFQRNHPATSLRAARVLVRWGPDAARPIVSVLTRMLDDDDWQSSAADLLGDMGPAARSAVSRLARMVFQGFKIERVRLTVQNGAAIRSTEKVWVASAAKSALGALRSIGPAAKSALPALSTTRSKIARMLNATKNQDARSQLEDFDRLIVAVMDEIGEKQGGRSKDEWLKVLGSHNAGERQEAMTALGRIGPSTVPALCRVATHRNPPAQKAACEVMSRFGEDASTALPTLARLTRTQDATVRLAAVRAIAVITDNLRTDSAKRKYLALVIQALESRRSDPDEEVRGAASDWLAAHQRRQGRDSGTRPDAEPGPEEEPPDPFDN